MHKWAKIDQARQQLFFLRKIRVNSYLPFYIRTYLHRTKLDCFSTIPKESTVKTHTTKSPTYESTTVVRRVD